MAHLNPAAAETVHYATDPRIRHLAEAAWRMRTGGTRMDWLMLGKDNPEALITEAREWVRAAVATGLIPAPSDDPAWKSAAHRAAEAEQGPKGLNTETVAVSPTAVLLATPCTACTHPLNWHTGYAACTVPTCDCGRYQPPGDAPAAEEPETDEQRADREETERAHAAGDHQYCGPTCEVEFPSDMLRNAILARAIPGSARMLDELLRRAAPSVADRSTAPLADCATEYRVPVPENGGTELRLRRGTAPYASGWSVAVPGYGGGMALTELGWSDSIGALSVDRLFCWPDAATAVDEARRALGATEEPGR
ncbi:hypothetical protein ACFYXM_08935 [Streptomyces sp. NPDC002476]|uniref:hypothetical protein n=1 Tax=Streptomyces sp. NPDC002476 TaxID=3364648 RepID=UPI003691A703